MMGIGAVESVAARGGGRGGGEKGVGPGGGGEGGVVEERLQIRIYYFSTQRIKI